MVVGGAQAKRLGGVVQALNQRPGNRQAVPGRGAAANFVQDHQRPGGGPLKDLSCFAHFYQKGRSPISDVIAGANPGQHAVEHAQHRRLCWHKAARLGQDHRQRHLAHQRGLAGHVGAGNQQQLGGLKLQGPAGLGIGDVAGQHHVIGHKGAVGQGLL